MKKILILSLLFFPLISIINVDAANICTATKYNELKREAYKVELTWDLKFDDAHNHYFEVTVANMNKDVLLKFGDAVYEANDDGSQFIINTVLEGGNTYEFKFYGGYDNPCVEEYIYTKELTLPKYNKYNELEECIEYEEFPLCNKWYPGDIKDKDYFLEQLEIYKKSLEKPEEPKPVVENKNIFQKIWDFYINNIKITFPITMLIILSIIILVIIKIRKKKKKIKINLDI